MRVIERPQPGMALISGAYGPRLWTRGKARKPGYCCLTGESFQPGEEVYRPMSNDAIRMRRARASFVDTVVLP